MSYAFTRHSAPAYARLVPAGNSLAFESSFSRPLLDELKLRIPHEARKWDPAKKRWLIDPTYAQVCSDLARAYLGVDVPIPGTFTAVKTVEVRLVKLDYLGRAKDRGNGQSTAFGHAMGDWTLIFPEEVLREWFDAPKSPTEHQTLYSILAVKRESTPEEIRAGYRRMARMWHPDLCHEPDATEQFKRIQAAWEVLGDDLKRRKYNAGLYLEAQSKKSREPSRMHKAFTPDGEATYCAPYRCGYVLVQGSESLGRFVVAKIFQWEDVVDQQGRTMVTSWPLGSKTFEVNWV